MVYDVTKSSSKCLIRLLSYDRDIFRLSVKEILVLKLKQEENGMNGFYI